MASETITVYIDPSQLAAQKANNYSLFLAKMVNGQFTVIWQSLGANATVNNPAVYEYQNTFDISVPSYEVNYGTVTTTSGSVTFSASGLAQSIDVGQSVVLEKTGIFDSPTNSGTPGEITISNSLAGNPNAILNDNQGNAIFVNTQSGMDIGTATLTPVDTYQIWFDNLQDTGTIIAHNVSNPATVTFSGGSMSQTISYNSTGEWQNGPLASAVNLAALTSAGKVGNPFYISVLATFKYALTVGSATYLLSKLMGKFSGGLRPKKIGVQGGSSKLYIEFEGPNSQESAAVRGLDKYEDAVNQALLKAKADGASGLQSETWTLSEPVVTVAYGPA